MKYLNYFIFMILMVVSTTSFAEDTTKLPTLSVLNNKAALSVLNQEDDLKNALNSSLTAQEITGAAPGILIVLSLENKGENAIKINLDKAITVDRILTKDTKIKSLEKFTPNLFEDLGIGEKAVNHKLNVVYLAPGTKKEVSYFVQTFSKGLFYITFLSEIKGDYLPNENGKVLPLAFYTNKIIYIPDENHKN